MNWFSLRAPKPGTRFAEFHDRLALFHAAAEDQTYWSDYWLSGQARDHLVGAARGDLDSGFDVFWRLLSEYGKPGCSVLEGGCGPGHLVAALDHRGYVATGIDYVPKLVEFSTSILPSLDVRLGDVEGLPFSDETFDCYASLGVVEHFPRGPERAIAEGHRVVRPGGIAIFELPYLNALRAAHLSKVRNRKVPTEGLTFHQYYYSDDEFCRLLTEAGFEVIERVPNCWDSVLMREHPVFSRFWSSSLAVLPVRRRLRRLIKEMPKPGRLRYAHTMAFACRRH